MRIPETVSPERTCAQSSGAKPQCVVEVRVMRARDLGYCVSVAESGMPPRGEMPRHATRVDLR